MEGTGAAVAVAATLAMAPADRDGNIVAVSSWSDRTEGSI